MTYWFIAILIFSYFLIAAISYMFLFKYRHLISYHLGMNIAMTASSMIGLAVGTVLGATFPFHDAIVIVITTIMAVAIGILFGALVDYQTLITGVSGGIMAGLMGPMLGFHTTQPLILIIFCTFLVIVSFGLLCFSVRS